MTIKLVSWNVAGVRAMLKKGNLEEMLIKNSYDIVLLQETKAEESQVKLPETIMKMYPHRYWHSTKGTTQRKGLSGTAIWCKSQPIKRIDEPEIDEEGRIITLEFEKFIVLSVYTPNSQGLDKPRFIFRTSEWHKNFGNYITMLKDMKPTIIAGDLDVAHKEIDIHNPKKHKNKYAGFFDLEREQMSEYLDRGYKDAFRDKYPTEEKKYTYWNQLNPKIRENNSGWRIDYFLTTSEIIIKDCNILPDIRGSDHCPINLEIEENE